MGRTVDVTIPVEPEAAAALADARNREAVGRLVSRVLRPRGWPGRARPQTSKRTTCPGLSASARFWPAAPKLKKSGTVAKPGVAHHVIEGGWFRHGLAHLAHKRDVPAQGLPCHFFGFLRRSARGDAAGKVRKAGAEVSVGIFFNDRDVFHNLRSLIHF